MSVIKLDASKQYYATSNLVIGYALCSSLLAIINKFAIYPGLLTALQYLISVGGVYLIGKLGLLHHYSFNSNLLSLMMASVFWVLTGEYADVFQAVRSSSGWLVRDAFLAVGLSCIFRLMISFFGFVVRKAISATAFTVTGVVNKSVAINVHI